MSFIKMSRNVASVLIGLITYVIMEIVTTYVFMFLLKVPILSFLMTAYIPSDIFLFATVASSATFTTVYVVKLISTYKSTNYSVIIVFSILLAVYLIAFIYKISVEGFGFVKLTPTAIFICSLLVGCFMAKENQ